MSEKYAINVYHKRLCFIFKIIFGYFNVPESTLPRCLTADIWMTTDVDDVFYFQLYYSRKFEINKMTAHEKKWTCVRSLILYSRKRIEKDKNTEKYKHIYWRRVLINNKYHFVSHWKCINLFFAHCKHI